MRCIIFIYTISVCVYKVKNIYDYLIYCQYFFLEYSNASRARSSAKSVRI